MTINKWELEPDARVRRRAGKTGEEVSELGSVVARIQIQGIDAIDPGTGQTNRQRMVEETADVLAQCNINMLLLFTPKERAQIRMRKAAKIRQMLVWESLYDAD